MNGVCVCVCAGRGGREGGSHIDSGGFVASIAAKTPQQQLHAFQLLYPFTY